MALFGRRDREKREEAEREQSRRALFEELAKRPANVCPFLGLAGSQTEYHDAFTREHRCYAFGDPVELSAQQQERVCLGRGYGNCPRFLRGVLVIPTEELEALRRPVLAAQDPLEVPAPIAAAPSPDPEPTRLAARRLPILFGIVLLVMSAGAAGAAFLLRGGAANTPTATPLPTVFLSPSAQPSPSTAPTPSEAPTATQPALSQTPFPETPIPGPTPLPGDTFVRFEVTVLQGYNTIFEIDDAGNIVRTRTATFSRFSEAPVERIVAPNGLLYWRTTVGDFIGLSYIHDKSGPFLIREVYEGADGEHRYFVLPDSEV